MYEFKTTPYAHQATGFELSRDLAYFALPMDMGTGKTKLVIDTAGYLYEQGRINALVVVAPNSVSSQWVNEQLPKHLPDRIPRRAAVWYATPRVAEKKAWEVARRSTPGALHVLAFNYEALTSPRGKKELWWILEHSQALLVLDESHRAKSPGAKTTKALEAASRRAPYRRILSGTPFDNSPLDAYTQFRFLHPGILRQPTFAAFKARYAEVQEHCSRCKERLPSPRPDYCPECFQRLNDKPQYKDGHRVGGEPVFPVVIGYRNQEELRDLIAPHCFRVRKDLALDLPPKIYETRPVVMTPEQNRLYAELLQEGMAILPKDGRPFKAAEVEQDLWELWTDPTTDKVVAKTALTNMLRRRQVLGGFLEEAGEVKWREVKNPRLRALLDVLQDIDGKVLIWAAFKEEVKMILASLPPGSAVPFYGEIPQRDREENKARFIGAPECRYFVGTAASGGTGVDGLVVANTVIYYSNSLKAGDRWQSEDRAHRIGQTRSVTYVDLLAPGTLDEKIVETFVTKRKSAEFLLGDAA